MAKREPYYKKKDVQIVEVEETLEELRARGVYKGNTEMVIEELVNLRIKRFFSSRSLTAFLYKIGYERSYSFVLIGQAKDLIVQMYKEDNIHEFETYRARLEYMIETTNDPKYRLDCTKELIKLTGSYRPQQVDITTNGKDMNINKVIVEIINNKEDLKDE